MSPFDFSQFNSTTRSREVQLLGLTEQQLQELLRDRYGLSETLIEHFPDITTRNFKPTSTLKCGIIWEHLQRDCSYADIVDKLREPDRTPPTEDTVYQSMSRYRKMVYQAFGLRIRNDAGRVYVVTQQSVEDVANKLERRFGDISKKCEILRADLDSLRAEGKHHEITGTAGAFLRGYEEVKRLEASIN